MTVLARAVRIYNMTQVMVRPARIEDKEEWLELWHGYCRFYEQVIPEHVTEETWTRILSRDSAIWCLVAADETGNLLGLANYVLHPNTWSTNLVCYLEDLYVHPDARRRGVGRMLLDNLFSLAGTNRWSRVYWVTNAENTRARGLYDLYGQADGVVRYSIAIDLDLLF